MTTLLYFFIVSLLSKVFLVKEPSICEEKNFNSLFHEHYETIRNHMYFKCGDLDQAEDLVQNAYVELWKRCADVLFQKAKSYLYKACHNSFLNQISHKKVVLKFEKHSNQANVNQESPEYLMEVSEFKLRLEKAISELPVKEREVFLLSRIEKKTYKEIAEIVGVTVKGIERRMSKALLQLRETLGKDHKI
jgi:RNA polymerase sigma-70 factor (ECF subfamily)